jgi:hypothetical protein
MPIFGQARCYLHLGIVCWIALAYDLFGSMGKV